MFPDSDQWEFTKMADDVVAATRYLLNAGVIDRQRIAISGIASSAYLAMAAAEADPELFRAVIAIHGTYDWAGELRAMKTGGFGGVPLGVLTRHIGDDARLAELSVNNRVDRIRAAVLVGYQRESGDSTKQSTNLISDLNRARVVHEAAPIGNDRSTINLVRNRVEIFSRAEAFLAKHLK
jgi:dipeptidyl aminopeptidase/acylaminoacyl peptidase